MKRKTVLIAGGTGLIGLRLQEMLRDHNYHVRVLTRKPTQEHEFAWDPLAGTIDSEALNDTDVVINLAGAGIADLPWSPERKKVLIDSRVKSAQTLRNAMQSAGTYPKLYISASAIGYYGDTADQVLYEDSPPGNKGFMPECCIAWENAAETVGALVERFVVLRIGVVMSPQGGALAEILKPMRFGVGAWFGKGQAWWPWIHRDDLCRMFLWAIETPNAEGIYNAVGPEPLRNKDLVKQVAKAYGRPVLCAPAPALALRLVLGEMSAVVLNSNRVSSAKIQAAGFRFQHLEVADCLK